MRTTSTRSASRRSTSAVCARDRARTSSGRGSEATRPRNYSRRPPDIRSTKKVEPVKATTEEEEPDPDAVDAKASMADEADDVQRSARPFLDIGMAPFVNAGNRKARRRGKRGPNPPPLQMGEDVELAFIAKTPGLGGLGRRASTKD